jgi:phosphatidylglycerol:prolipoprotein diacylglycerol transferase
MARTDDRRRDRGGARLAARYGRERNLDGERLYVAALVLALAGTVGARLFWLLETDPAGLLRPGDWVGSRGFSLDGGIVFGLPALALYLHKRRLSLPYLDAMAAGFPLGLAVGPIGDVINGEHYGPPSELPWALRHTHPDASVPSPELAYHDGGLYEVVLGLALLAVVWPLRHRLRPAGTLLWTVIALHAAGRFAVFFWRSDSQTLALPCRARSGRASCCSGWRVPVCWPPARAGRAAQGRGPARGS